MRMTFHVVETIETSELHCLAKYRGRRETVPAISSSSIFPKKDSDWSIEKPSVDDCH